MITDEQLSLFANLLDNSQKIVIVQADNPDGDSLATALALEQILGEMGKDVYLYCSVDAPFYLRHLAGWDRLEQTLPSQYDAAIMIDNSSDSLLHNLSTSGQLATLKIKPLVILDHHPTETTIDYADIYVNDPKAASSGQIVYRIARKLDLPIDKISAGFLASSILSDSLGFNSEVMLNNPEPLRVMADLVEYGVDLSELNDLRLEQMKIAPEIIPYKGQLMQRIEFVHNNAVATITIPHQEIADHSMDYNPTVILDEMRMVRGVKIGIGFKIYERNGTISRVTARIRCNRGYTIAQELAEYFGGGGHPYASGIKWEDKQLDFDHIKKDVLAKTTELLEAHQPTNE